MKSLKSLINFGAAMAGVLGMLAAGPAGAKIDGVTGTSFTLTAKSGSIEIPDGTEPAIWGYALNNAVVQYPGPTMIVNQGANVTVVLRNALATTVSIIFPGQAGVKATPVSGRTGQGIMTLEAGPGGIVKYEFPAAAAGTYLYHSGTRPDLQVEMGLFGALIVRPTVGGAVRAMHAYDTMDAMYDQECLFMVSEMDPKIHAAAAVGRPVDTTGYFPTAWFINGRSAPDTMADAYAEWLPTQPYNCMPMMEAGQKLLMRIIGAGRDQHPFHFHGNHAKVIARDGRLLSSAPAAGADQGYSLYTIQTTPGSTTDAIFTWSGAGLGWDVFGHKPGDPKYPFELDSDHGKPFPVLLPPQTDLMFGAYYTGSPFLGMLGPLPPGEGGLSPTGGYFFMWHSHTEKEMTNNNVFPGGMMTMLLIEKPGTMTPMP